MCVARSGPLLPPGPVQQLVASLLARSCPNASAAARQPGYICRSCPSVPGAKQTLKQAMQAARFKQAQGTAGKWSTEVNLVGRRHPRPPNDEMVAGTPLDNWEAHTAKRIAQGHWKPYTSPEQYLRDLRSAAGHSTAEVFVGYEAGKARVGTLTDVQSLYPPLQQLGGGIKLHQLLVVYDPDKDVIVTGYPVVRSNAPHQPFRVWTTVHTVR